MREALTWARTRKTQLLLTFAVLLATGIGIFHFPHAAAAITLSDVMDGVMIFLTKLAQYGMQFMTALVLLLVQILIKAAQYNDFVHAYPVETGWSLVRDVVNMFFIVVLLVMAFATIVGYDALHYKNYLPKLLVMAVLINFSKTLIGVGIDFSQVIMLTFVNGFRSAAGGNFINALKLTDVTKLSTADVEAKIKSGESAQSPGNILIASILGLGMLFVSAAVILVFVIFIVARIIGLWMALIFSPIALFATALPDKMRKGMSAFTNQYWDRLTGMLTGGPIIAFFLWLSLATVQAKPDMLAFYNPDANESVSASAAITEAGQPASFSSFVVAIVMLLMGLDAAIKASNEVSPSALKLGNLGKNLAIGTTKWAAKKSVQAGRASARGSFRLMNEGLLAKNGQAFTERLGGKLLQTAGRGGIGSTLLAGAGTRLARAGGARRAEIRASQEAALKGLSPAQRLQYDRAHAGTGNKLEQAARRQRILDVESSDFGKKMFTDQAAEKYLKSKGIDPKRATAAEKKEAENHAAGAGKRTQAKSISELIKMYDEAGDTENRDKLKKKVAEDPSLNDDVKGIYGQLSSKDYQDTLKETKTDAFADSAFAAAFAKSYGLLDANGKPKSLEDIRSGEDTKDLWERLSKNPKRRQLMEQHLASWGSSADGKKTLSATLAEMDGSAPSGSSTRIHMTTSGQAFTMNAGSGVAALVPPPEFTESQQELLTKYADVASKDHAGSAFGEMTRAGIRPSQMGAYDSSSNRFVSPEARKSYLEMVAGASAEMGGIEVTRQANGEIASVDYVKGDDATGRKGLEQSVDTFANLDSSAILAGGEYAEGVLQNADFSYIDNAMANLDGLAEGKAERRAHSERAVKVAQVKEALSTYAHKKNQEILEKEKSQPGYQLTEGEQQIRKWDRDNTAPEDYKKVAAENQDRIRALAKQSKSVAQSQDARSEREWNTKVKQAKGKIKAAEKKQARSNKDLLQKEMAEAADRVKEERELENVAREAAARQAAKENRRGGGTTT